MAKFAMLVRGSGDIGSAVAHALFTAGFPVAIHDVPAPAHARRGRAFVDAFFDGAARLDGVAARLTRDADGLSKTLEEDVSIPVSCLPFESVLSALAPALLVDARMRKREIPECQRGLAPLVVGLGPNFVAGGNVDLVVETAWGERLGKVIFEGPSLPFTGEPRAIAGHARGRYVYAPVSGTFEAHAAIGSAVVRGRELARIGEVPIRAPLDGVLVGATRSGVDVRPGAKILEVDPVGDRRSAFVIGERAGAVAAGVLAIARMLSIYALRERASGRAAA